MKNKGLIIGIIAGVVVIAVVVVCIVMANNSKNSGSSDGSNGQSSNQVAENKDNKIVEVMKKLDAKMTLEEMNKIVGSDAKLEKEEKGWKKYVWEFGEKNQITATEYTSSKSMALEADYDDDLIKSEKADFSTIKDFKKKINSTEGVKYEDFVKAIGAEGTIEKKETSSIGYIWVNQKGGTLHAKFNTSSGKCTIFNGVF